MTAAVSAIKMIANPSIEFSACQELSALREQMHFILTGQ